MQKLKQFQLTSAAPFNGASAVVVSPADCRLFVLVREY